MGADHWHHTMKGVSLNLPKSDVLPIGSQTVAIALTTQLFSSLKAQEASAAFHAFLTFAPLCKTLDMYGFTGNQSADDHLTQEEHRLMAHLIKGNLSKSETIDGKARSTGAFSWLKDHLGDFRQKGRSADSVLVVGKSRRGPDTATSASKAGKTNQRPAIPPDSPSHDKFMVGQKVQRRDRGKEWGVGYVTSVQPLRVTIYNSPDTAGVTWHEVRPMDPSSAEANTHKLADQKFEPASVVWDSQKGRRATEQADSIANSKVAEEAGSTSSFSRLKKVMTMRTTAEPIAGHFRKCAIVGTSSKLLQQSWGDEIEAHDTVIRINRLPTEDHYVAVGRRTDVYFVRHNHAREGGFNGILPGTGEQRLCTYRRRLPGPCNISMLVMGGDVSKAKFHQYVRDASSFRWEDNLLPNLREKGFKSFVFPRNDPLPVSSQSKDVAAAAFMLQSPHEGKEPSTAIHGFLTFVSLCHSVTAYGFEEEEQKLIARLVETTQSLPKLEKVHGAKGGHTEAFKWLHQLFPLFAKRGRIKLVAPRDSSITAEK